MKKLSDLLPICCSPCDSSITPPNNSPTQESPLPDSKKSNPKESPSTSGKQSNHPDLIKYVSQKIKGKKHKNAQDTGKNSLSVNAIDARITAFTQMAGRHAYRAVLTGTYGLPAQPWPDEASLSRQVPETPHKSDPTKNVPAINIDKTTKIKGDRYTFEILKRASVADGGDKAAMMKKTGRIQSLSGFEEMQALSQANISRISKNLGKLTENEKAFLDRFFKLPAYAVHSTNHQFADAPHPLHSDPVFTQSGEQPKPVMRLYSLKNLTDRGIKFQRGHEPEDGRLRHLDFVFFSIEMGDSTAKTSSAMGKNMYRFAIDEHPMLAGNSWLSMKEMLVQVAPSARRLHEAGFISQESAAKLEQRDNVGGPEYVFVGKDMKRGMALSILEAVRTLPEDEQEKVLGARSTEMDLVLNTLFRPELKCPREFTGRPASVTLGDAAEDSITEIPD